MPDPPRLVETSWPDGRKRSCASDGKVNSVLRAARGKKIPFQELVANTRVWPDDGSDRWRDHYEKAR